MLVLPRAVRAPLAVATAFLLLGTATARTAPKSGPAPAPAAAPLPKPDNSPWLFKGSDIRPNPAWIFGTLPNGLRYAVRRNGVPPGQVAIRVRIDAGSLYENEDERGFAHLLEHMSFRASQYVPDGEAKRVWQRLGATFGSDSNAQTTPTQTVYRLDLPSATEASLDESLKILSGMMDKPVIDQKTLDSERPIVLSEQREAPGPAVRVGDAQRATLFAGQPLADRSPIGTIKTLEAATAEAVAAFHARWYRPERTVIAIAGDMDPKLLEQLVIKNFSSWTEPGPPTPDPDFGKPDPKQPSANAIVEPTQPVSVSYAVLRPWVFNNDTILFNQNRMVDTMATLVMNRRLEQRARAGGSFLTAQVQLDDIARSANVTFVNVLPIGDDWQAALRDVRAVIGELERAPPTASEVAQAVSDYDTSLRTRAETAAAEMGTAQADDIVGAVDIRETVASPEDSYDIFVQAKNKGFFTPERVFASAKKIFQGDATRAFLVTKQPGENLAAQLDAAVKAAAARSVARAKEGPVPTFAQLPLPPRAGKEVSRKQIADLGITEVTFANGVKLMAFPNKSEASRVYVRVRFGGGLQALPNDRETPAWAAPIALVASGVGAIDQEGLDRMTAGRRIGLDFSTDDDAFEFAATTSPADLNDQLRLIAAKLYRPRWDANPVLRARAAMVTGYDGLDASPSAVIQSRLEEQLHADDPRWGTPPLKDVQALTPAAFKAFWAPLLASGPIEVQVFGDVTVDEAVAAVARTMGALPPRPASAATPPPVRFPAHNATPLTLYHDGNDTQAAAVIAWPTASGVADIAESRRLEVLAAIFGDRLFEKLRQGSGVSYSPSVNSLWPTKLNGGGYLLAMGQVPPDRTGYFIQFARETAADLVANPVGEDEVKRILGPIGQALMRNATGNQFWMRLTEGATRDPQVYDSVRSIGADFGAISPATLQDTARKYLRPDKDWTMVVLPKAPGTAGR
jgi:zinc protease